MIGSHVQVNNNIYKKSNDKNRLIVLNDKYYQDNFKKTISLYTAKRLSFKGFSLQEKLEISKNILSKIPNLLSSTRIIMQNQEILKNNQNTGFKQVKGELDKVHKKVCQSLEKRNKALRKAYYKGEYSFRIHTRIVKNYGLKHKKGNCYESSFLVADELMKRGIFDFDLIHSYLYRENQEGIFINDHDFLVWHDGQKRYINKLKQLNNAVMIDSWGKKQVHCLNSLRF